MPCGTLGDCIHGQRTKARPPASGTPMPVCCWSTRWGLLPTRRIGGEKRASPQDLGFARPILRIRLKVRCFGSNVRSQRCPFLGIPHAARSLPCMGCAHRLARFYARNYRHLGQSAGRDRGICRLPLRSGTLLRSNLRLTPFSCFPTRVGAEGSATCRLLNKSAAKECPLYSYYECIAFQVLRCVRVLIPDRVFLECYSHPQPSVHWKWS